MRVRRESKMLGAKFPPICQRRIFPKALLGSHSEPSMLFHQSIIMNKRGADNDRPTS